MVPLTLALACANAGRAVEAQRVYDGVRDQLVRSAHDAGTPQVFWTYVEARIALVAGEPARAAQIALAMLNGLDEHSVDSPSDLMQLHATAAAACEMVGDDRRALYHERCRAVIRERLARLAAHVASLTHTIRHELDTTRAERDRFVKLHAELKREHERLATLNGALTIQIAENLRLHDELKEQNFRDALTGLHNRRYLYERGSSPARRESGQRRPVVSRDARPRSLQTPQRRPRAHRRRSRADRARPTAARRAARERRHLSCRRRGIRDGVADHHRGDRPRTAARDARRLSSAARPAMATSRCRRTSRSPPGSPNRRPTASRSTA